MAWEVFLAAQLVASVALATTPTPSPTPNPTLLACTGNCDGGASVSIDELIRGVNISLGQLSVESCPRFDADGNGAVSINELVRAVGNALYGCGVVPPTRMPTKTATVTATPAPLTPTPTASPTPTATRTATHTATPTPPTSICGGTITSVPKLCDLELVPSAVPLSDPYFVLRYCLSDREGDIRLVCVGIQTSPAPPFPECRAVTPAGGTINGCFESARISTNPVGNYNAILYFEDEAGQRSNTAEAPFRVVP